GPPRPARGALPPAAGRTLRGAAARGGAPRGARAAARHAARRRPDRGAELRAAGPARRRPARRRRRARAPLSRAPRRRGPTPRRVRGPRARALPRGRGARAARRARRPRGRGAGRRRAHAAPARMSAAMRRTAVNGIEIEWEAHGEGPRALVLVHGFTGSRRDFAPRVPELAALGRTVLPDLRGHGGSTNTGDPAGYTLEQLADDLLAFLAAEGLSGCDLLGHSLGGMVVLRAALAAPERIGSLILMNTAARAPDPPSASHRPARQVCPA